MASAVRRRRGAQRASRRAPIDLVFDGNCGFCTRAVAWVQRLDRHQRVRLHPAQRPGVLRRFGLSNAEAAAAVWAFQPPKPATGHPGFRYRGAEAACRAVDAALGIRCFVPVSRLPGIAWVGDRAYRWVAANRSRLRGVTPWCTQYPADCGGVDR